MKARNLSLWDIFRIRTALFLGKVRWLKRDEAQALWKGYRFDGEARCAQRNWITRQLGENLFIECGLGWEIYRHWVSLVTTECEAKDAFFSGRQGAEASDTGEDEATAKWLSFLTDTDNEYHRDMVWMLAAHWTSTVGRARDAANGRRKQCARHMLCWARDLVELRAAHSFAQHGLDRERHSAWIEEAHRLYLAQQSALIP
jgi:hypothetical protein